MFKTTIAAFLLAVAAGAAHAAPQVVLTPTFDSVSIGQVFDIAVSGTGFGTTSGGLVIDNVQAGQNFSFSFTNLELLQVTIDSRWTLGNNAGTINNAAGTLTGFRFGTFPATTDDNFNIGSFSVKALAAGPASFSLGANTIVGKVNGVASQTIIPAIQQAQITVVSEVPEPQEWVLMLLGLGLFGLKLRRQR